MFFVLLLKGKLIGYYNKSQPTPKPIYKKGRIVLGGMQDDDSYDAFISANEVSEYHLMMYIHTYIPSIG